VSEERLQKILARAGVTSRRKAETLIEEGRVTVDGKVATLGDKADPDSAAIKVDGKRVEPRTAHRYLLMNKPPGVMSTRSDPEGRPTVLDLVPARFHKALVPVGRLDFQTEGLLLLTDDGDFAHRVTHPRYGCHKVYEVKVKGQPPAAELEKLRQRGVVVDGRHTVPVRIDPLRVSGPREGKNTWWTVELAEGRTRQIREMFFRIGHPVQRLRRVAIGPLRDASLAPGALRELTEQEVEALRGSTRGGRSTKGGRRPTGWAKSSRRRSRRSSKRRSGRGPGETP
jgi:23S rRNA pseudouridine2605 synthase